MNPRIIHPDYMVRIRRLYGVAPEVVAQLLMHFIRGTTPSLICVYTQVDLVVINQISRSAWRTALRPRKGARYWSRVAHRFLPIKPRTTQISEDHLDVLADLHRLHAPESAILSYLTIIGTDWASAHKQLRERAAMQRSLVDPTDQLELPPPGVPTVYAATVLNRRKLSRDYYHQAIEVHGMTFQTAEIVLHHFARSTPMATISTYTGVHMHVLNRLYSLPWWDSVVPERSAPNPHPTTSAVPPQPPPGDRELTRELKALHLPVKVIRHYIRTDKGT